MNSKINPNFPLNKDLLRTTDAHIKRLSEIGINTIKDLFFHLPRDHEIDIEIVDPSQVIQGEKNSVRGHLVSLKNERSRSGKLLTKGILRGRIGEISLIWFSNPYIKRALNIGDEYIMRGMVKQDFSGLSMQTPSFENARSEIVHSKKIISIYPETDLGSKNQKGKISSKWLREKIHMILFFADEIEETLPKEIIKEENLLDIGDAIKNIHFPESNEKLEKAKYRFSFEEVFLLQVRALERKIELQGKGNAPKIKMEPELIKKFLSKLEFDLTDSQKISLYEILKDMEKAIPMNRLLEGDVGSGKTVVVAGAILSALNKKLQCAFMAPTEILAKQHFEKINEYLGFALKSQEDLFSEKGQNKGRRFKHELLIGSMSEKKKKEIRSGLKDGEIDLIIGTHALIQSEVKFKNLGLAIIDEQHRFGVGQRDLLSHSGNPHVLNMTATPIPRTLALSLYGDQDLSIINELPKGRKKVITKVINEKNRRKAYLWIDDQIEKGNQVFVVCPLISESENLQTKAVEDEYVKLRDQIFPNRKVELLHGKVKAKEKDEIMKKFREKEFDILVATPVIEVGIDIPNATVMVIEGAERFGLAALHQLRGRVGRSEKASYCFLFTSNEEIAKTRRLSALEKIYDGFELSKIDLQIRGPGQVFGTMQSGISDFKSADILDAVLVNKARNAASKFLKIDV